MKDYLHRIPICLAGLLLYGFGNVFSVAAGSAGTNAWNTLALGIGNKANLSFGTATFCISLAIVIIDLVGKGKLGIGTLLNMTVIPVCSEWFMELLSFVPTAPNAVVGACYTLFSQVIFAFATILYMFPGLGCGPRDTLMVLIGRKVPRLPIGSVKFCIELAALGLGVVLGAPFGIGSVLSMALQASIFQAACKLVRYEPRAVQHESLLDTWRRFAKADSAQ